MRWALVFAALVAFLACKEEYTQHGIHVLNPVSDTDETEPADDDDPVDATTTSVPLPADAATDATDARPADARADARDTGPG